MFPLFETICINNGICQNLEYHLNRINKSYFEFYKKKITFDLFKNICVPEKYQIGIKKLLVSYNENAFEYVYKDYKPQKILKLKLIFDNEIDYSLKYTDRSCLNILLQKKENCDDILIVKNGLITDVSFANIVFFDKTKWITPLNPLLKGTARERLLNEKTIYTKNIKIEDLQNYTFFKLINAMRDFKTEDNISINSIVI